MLRSVRGSRDGEVTDHAGRRELAVFALAYVTYFGVRILTEGRASIAVTNARDLIHLERVSGLAQEQVVQSTVTGSALLTDVANGVYMYGHWPVLLVSGFLLFRWRRPDYRLLRNACLISGLVGLVIFAVFPVAPPRLTDLPIVDTVTLGAPGYRLLLPHSLVNEYAAMPSFHAGWNLLAGIVVFRATASWALRGFAVTMPIAMAFAVVATANHYVLDVLAGAAIVLLSLATAMWIERRREASRLVEQVTEEHEDAREYADGLTFRDRPQGGKRPVAAAIR